MNGVSVHVPPFGFNGQGDNRPYIQIIERRKDIILMAKKIC